MNLVVVVHRKSSGLLGVLSQRGVSHPGLPVRSRVRWILRGSLWVGRRFSQRDWHTTPDSTAPLSFLTLTVAACAGFPVNRVMIPAFQIARSQSLWSAVQEIPIAMYGVSVLSTGHGLETPCYRRVQGGLSDAKRICPGLRPGTTH